MFQFFTYCVVIVCLFVSGCSSPQVYSSVRPAYVSSLSFKGYTQEDLLIEQARLEQYALMIIQEVQSRHSGQAFGAIAGIFGSIMAIHGANRGRVGQTVVGSIVAGTGFALSDLSQMDDQQLEVELATIKGNLDAISVELRKLGVDESLIYSEDKLLHKLAILDEQNKNR